MKAQIKAIVASAVVIALCLAAVGGVTYSWFSDSEQSTIEVETAKVAIETGYSHSEYGTVSTSITTYNGIDTIEISKLSANCTSTITGTITDYSTIAVKYKVDATINNSLTSPLTSYDKANIFINGTSLKQINDSTNIVPWTDLTAGTKTFTVNVTTPSSYGGMPGESIYYNTNGDVVNPSASDALLWEPSVPRGFSITLKVIAVQGDYQEAPTIENSVMTNTLSNGSTTISSDKPGVNGAPALDQNLSQGENKVSNVTVQLSAITGGEQSFTIISKKTTSDGGTFSVNSNEEALAVLEFNANNGFNSAQVIVDIKGMIPNPTVIYNGSGEAQPTNISSEYIIKDGTNYTRIYFTTNHFSEYLILDKDSSLTVTNEAQLRLALQSGIDVKLDANININDQLTIDGQKVTLDLNNHSITSTKSGIYVTNNADLTITDSGTDGSIKAGINDNGSYWALKASDSIVLIEDGYFYVGSDGSKSQYGEGNSCIIAADANITITGGLFETKASWNDRYYVLNITQTHGDTYGFNVLGGTFVNYDPTNGDDVIEGTFVAQNYNSVYVGHNKYEVLPEYQITFNDSIKNASENDNIIIPPNKLVYLYNDIANGLDNSRNVNFIGNGTQTVDVITKTVSAEGGQLNYQRGSTFTFENLTIQAGEGSFDGIVCDELIFKNCTITGKLTLYGKATFTECTFENNMENQYSIWTWGGTDVTFENCTFNTNGKAILLYGSGPTNLIVNNCTFNDRNNGTAGKAAIEIGNDYKATYTLTIYNPTVKGFAEGKNTGSILWANKNSMDAAHLTVTINGVQQSL